MYHEGRWVTGDRRWGIVHEGRLYLFASEQAKRVFWHDPNRYAPVFGGDDIVIFVESGQRVPGQVRIGAKQGDQDPRTYLFASEQSYQKFYWNPAFYIDRLRQMTNGAAGR
jgi:YHS domain-containing protein